MKFELDNSPAHLRAMRNTFDEVRAWISGYEAGECAAKGSQFTELSPHRLHLGQIRILLTELTHQAEAKTAKTSKRKR